MSLDDLKGTKEIQAYTNAQTVLEKLMGSLTDQQKVYVEGRLSGLVPYAACKAAGFVQPESQAYRLERTPKIRDVLDAASSVARISIDMDRGDVLQGLMDALQMCANATEMTNVWKEIGKIIGAYQPIKIEHTHSIGDMTNDQLQRMSNRDLVKMVDEPGAIIDVTSDPVDAEFEVLKESVKPAKPIDYNNNTEIVDGDSTTPSKDL